MISSLETEALPEMDLLPRTPQVNPRRSQTSLDSVARSRSYGFLVLPTFLSSGAIRCPVRNTCVASPSAVDLCMQVSLHTPARIRLLGCASAVAMNLLGAAIPKLGLWLRSTTGCGESGSIY